MSGAALRCTVLHCAAAPDMQGLVTWSAVLGWANSAGYLVGALLGARGLTPTGRGRTMAGGMGNAAPFSLFVVAMYALAKVTQLVWKGSKCRARPLQQSSPLDAADRTK